MSSHDNAELMARAQDHPEWESSPARLEPCRRPAADGNRRAGDRRRRDRRRQLRAGQAGLRVAPQATGHGSYVLAAGDGTMVVKLEKMRGVEIDVDSATARVAGRCAVGRRDRRQHAARPGRTGGLVTRCRRRRVHHRRWAQLAGPAPRAGLQRVRAVEIVTANGELVRADPDTNPDLFWAVRGGGGAFGVITAFELELYPVDEVYGGAMLWPIERDTEVLQAWRAWIDTVPDEVTSLGRLLHLPPIPEIPEPFRGRDFVAVEAVCLMDAADGAAMLEPLRALGPEIDMFGMMPAAALEKLHMDPEGPVPGIGEGMVLADVTDETIEAAVRTAGNNSGSALVSFEFRHLGGAVARPSEGAGCLASLDDPFIAFGVGMTPVPPLVEAVKGSVSATFGALEPWRGKRQLPSWRESVTAPAEMFGTSYERLLTVKADVDPEQPLPVEPLAVEG